MSLINGYEYDYNTIELSINGKTYVGIQSIDYSETMERTAVRGTNPKVQAYTRGQYSAECSFEMLYSDYQSMVSNVTNKFDTNYTITVTYSNPGNVLITDTIIGGKLKDVGKSHSVGADALVVSCSLDVMEILENGKSSVADNDALDTILAVGGALGSLGGLL